MDERASRVRLSDTRIAELVCPPGKAQAFLWDTEAPNLAVRVTPTKRKTFIFEARLHGKTLRLTIGDVKSWPLDALKGDKDAKTARREARRLTQLVDAGTDPREEIKRQREQANSKALSVADVWPLYLENGRPKRREAWKPRYLADLKAMALAGGEPKKRGKGLTRQGPLYPLLAMPLASINEDTLKIWFDREAKSGKHQATRALMMFRGFLRWCTTQPQYRALIDRAAGKAPAIVENLPTNTRRTDALETSQVKGWWEGVEQLNNRTASAYLRALLLTGARREEMAALTWANVDFQWRKLTIADKVEATRTIPLTPYMAQMLFLLPRVGPHVFASSGKLGRIADVRASHAKALQSASIEGLTIHGLRRSFSLLGEVAGAPAGAIAQVMGHKPSATAEGYRPRSVDALRPFLAQIEAHILALAGVDFQEHADPGKLMRVK